MPVGPDPTVQDLLRQADFTAAMLDSLEEGIVACDADGILRLFNAATRRFHGVEERALPPDEWAGHYDLYRADGITPLPTDEIPLFRALRGEVVVDAEMVIAPRGGAARTILATGRAIVDEAGRKLGAVVAMHDVTERRMVEDELSRRRVALRQAAEINDNIIASLVTATAALDRGDERGTRRALQETLHEASRIVTELTDGLPRLPAR